MSIKIIQEDHKSNTSQENFRYNQNQNLINQKSIPEIHHSNSILAVKRLKQKQDALHALKKRLSVLKIHQQKSVQRFKINQRKMNYHQQTRSLIQEEKMIKQKYFRNCFQNIQRSRNFNNNQRVMRKQRLDGVRNQLYQMKHEQYNDVRQMSQFIDSNIKQKKLQESLQKQFKRDNIIQFQRKQKLSLQRYRKTRILEQLDEKAFEVQKMNDRARKRDIQLLKLSKIQAQLLEKQSKSQMIAQQSNDKFLKMVMNPQTLQKQIKKKAKKNKKGIVPQVQKNQQQFFIQEKYKNQQNIIRTQDPL